MKQAILIHGWAREKEYFDLRVPSPSNNHWFPWLQHQLISNGILAQTPEMPDAYLPEYEKWRTTFEQFSINEDTLLIGHSCGAGFLVRWLCEHPEQKVGKVILVAPFLDPDNEIGTGFFDFAIDSDLAARTNGVTVLHSLDDHASVIKSVATLKEKLANVSYIEFTNKGHFCLKDLGGEAFPELLEAALDK